MATEGIYDLVFTPDEEWKFIPTVVANHLIVIMYVLFCKVIGPSVMDSRKPFNLKSVLLLFNLGLVASNACVSFYAVRSAIQWWPYKCGLKIHMNQLKYTEQYQEVEFLGVLLYFVKLAELFDTVFFVLRKKYGQVSFLNVFHHAAVVMLVREVIAKQEIGYYLLLAVGINCGLHVLMYFYYAMAAFGPSVRKYLWWKKYLTTIQIIQFILVLSYMLVGIALGCEQLGFVEKAMFTITFVVMLLFLNYYKKTYK